jgi:hypothetical protein
MPDTIGPEPCVAGMKLELTERDMAVNKLNP